MPTIRAQAVAEMCGVHLKTVFSWRQRGHLKSYEPKDVAEFLRTRYKLELLKELSDWADVKKLEV